MITTLSPELVRLIAAGEVVQHPTSAAKELIENALDAGATEIAIEAVESGSVLLSVSDNGSGMSPADLALAWQPHTTSKLQQLEDLTRIGTFGFRGEALSSLAQVSRLQIRSRRRDDPTASLVEVEQGQLVAPVHAQAGTLGTRVTIHSLFANTPGRRQRRSPRTEVRELVKLVSAYALIFPQISWHLKCDGKSWSWPARQTRIDRAANHWSDATAQEFLPLRAAIPGGQIEGVLAIPRLARRQSQAVLSINGRWVEWPELQQLVRKSYGTLLEAGMQPAWTLHLTLDPQHIDPNIHPTKHQVRLFEEEKLLAALEPLFLQTLEEQFLIGQRQQLWRVAESAPEQAAGDTLRTETILSSLESSGEEIAQLRKLYLVTSTPDGLLLIDQHAAHERIRYEEFLHSWESGHIASTPLEPAVPFAVSAQDELLLQEHLSSLEATGWELEAFSPGHWIIRAIPQLLHDRPPQSLLRGALDDLEAGLLEGSLHPHHHRLLATLACRSAIKAGQELSPAARKKLLQQLAHTKTSFACPHGRPVSVLIPWREVETWFHR